MKKLLLIFILLISLFSCSKEIIENNNRWEYLVEASKLDSNYNKITILNVTWQQAYLSGNLDSNCLKVTNIPIYTNQIIELDTVK